MAQLIFFWLVVHYDALMLDLYSSWIYTLTDFIFSCLAHAPFIMDFITFMIGHWHFLHIPQLQLNCWSSVCLMYMMLMHSTTPTSLSLYTNGHLLISLHNISNDLLQHRSLWFSYLSKFCKYLLMCLAYHMDCFARRFILISVEDILLMVRGVYCI